jgi:hypothetical protein
MAEPDDSFVLLHKKKNGAVFAKVKTAPENSPAPITNPRVDVSVTNGGSPWDMPVLCVAKDETSVDIMCRMFCCNFLRKSRL